MLLKEHKLTNHGLVMTEDSAMSTVRIALKAQTAE